jgi:hypothetical protein
LISAQRTEQSRLNPRPRARTKLTQHRWLRPLMVSLIRLWRAWDAARLEIQ